MATQMAKKQSKGSGGEKRYKPRGGRLNVPDPRVHGRSRLTNGKDLLPSVDQRSLWARIWRDVYAAIVSHCGGVDHVTETRRMMARRCACLETELVFLESKFANVRADGGEPALAEVEVYGRLAGNQRRIAETLGWERTSKDITPHPLDYARQLDAEEAEAV